MNFENNKRIAKNTLILYFRMLLTMLVSLYTVRIVLDTLGTEDYGLYNVVGGLVTMFTFLSATMASASQRFFAYEIGKQNQDALKKTFSMTMSIYLILAIFILILAETVGLWFLNNKMNIPFERITAIRWVYQFSILSFLLTMFAIPYNAVLVAREKLDVYAYVSIIEVILKLVIVYLLVLFEYDKLILYSVLTFSTTLLVTSIYRVYCLKNFDECIYIFHWDTKLFKVLLTYSGWNIFGALAGLSNGQGINILLNIFFGPIVNAARGIAYQANHAVKQFVQNFMMATRPQIIKLYASGQHDAMLRLVLQSSKLSYILLFIITLPILLETNIIFSFWLKETPEYVVLFTRLVIITALIDSLSNPLMTAAQATGRIRKYQTIVGSIMLLNLPISYLFLRWSFPPQIVFYLGITNSIICLIARLIMLNKMINLPIKKFFFGVFIRIVVLSTFAYIPLVLLQNTMIESIVRFIIVSFIGVLLSIGVLYTFGLTETERNTIKKSLKKIKKNV